jgi:hypothetical protein
MNLRVLLLVLLALLLPVRGALAGASPCASSARAAHAHAEAHAHAHAHAVGGSHGVQADTRHAHHHGASTGGEQFSGAVDPCSLCAASCSATPFVSEPLSMALPMAAAGAPFPAFVAPPPSHGTDGPERPPRST